MYCVLTKYIYYVLIHTYIHTCVLPRYYILATYVMYVDRAIFAVDHVRDHTYVS